jgi:hypothetical protein
VVFAERARTQVELLAFPGAGHVTMSAGIVEVKPGEDPRAAVMRADAQLYEAKGAGRNLVKGKRNRLVDVFSRRSSVQSSVDSVYGSHRQPVAVVPATDTNDGTLKIVAWRSGTGVSSNFP